MDRQGPELGRRTVTSYAGDPTPSVLRAGRERLPHQVAPTAPNYYEWCGDHNKPLERKPFGDVGSGGPVTLPDANIFANGAWYGGSPISARTQQRAPSAATPIPPSGTVANDPT